MFDYKSIIENIDWNKNNGLVPVIIQDLDGTVLTLGYMNKEALNKTLETNLVHYYSRSKNRIRMKGETSGNYQKVKETYIDCDNDTLLIKVEQIGAACHLGTKSCFRKIEEIEQLPESTVDYSLDFLNELKETIKDRKKTIQKKNLTQVTYLKKEKKKYTKKFGEEAVEVLVAPNRERIIYETADLIYHLLVLLCFEILNLEKLYKNSKKRHKEEGIKKNNEIQ